MSFFRDQATRRFFLFFVAVSFAAFLVGIAGCGRCMGTAKDLFLAHDSAVAGSLLAQGVPEEVIASAIISEEDSDAGVDFLEKIGVSGQTKMRFLPFLFSLQSSILLKFVLFMLLFSAILLCGAAIFFNRQEKLYRDAAAALRTYMESDDKCRLPQLHEGALYEMFSEVDRLLTTQRAKNETEQRAKQFLKHTISDISHQLKTPLAALSMYQEIIEEESENEDAVKEFSVKIKAALSRMERLIQLMLKITRLDAGSIVFEKKRYQVYEVVRYALEELSMRAETENKTLTVEGNRKEMIVCDMEWTAEAIGNLIKNALDHTSEGGHIRITWESSPELLRLSVADDGCGISDEDIYHIFKRFYRSRSCSDTFGIGLGLPLAKAIAEGQDGVLSVESHVGEGTTFTLSLPYETTGCSG